MLLTGTAILVLTHLVDLSKSTERLEMIKVALAVGAGTGAALTLVLARRRQSFSEHDASERRLTELYMKAVEQLGSDKAAVRHGALYALERVAQDNPDHRQTVVDVMCAYLRAPYLPTPAKSNVPRLGRSHAPLRRTRMWPVTTAASTAATPNRHDQEQAQEREVRVTAQRILHRHLQPGRNRRADPTFWPGVDLDLTGATLIDFTLHGSRISAARFTRTQFIGEADFRSTSFAVADFSHAHFGSAANFNGAEFKAPPFDVLENPEFNSVRIFHLACFHNATFSHGAYFYGAKFNASTEFDGAQFDGDTTFQEAYFDSHASFSGVRFNGNTYFIEVQFRINMRFWQAKFYASVDFSESTFGGSVRFTQAQFGGSASFANARFDGDVLLDGAEFSQAVPAAIARYLPTSNDEIAGDEPSYS